MRGATEYGNTRILIALSNAGTAAHGATEPATCLPEWDLQAKLKSNVTLFHSPNVPFCEPGLEGRED